MISRPVIDEDRAFENIYRLNVGGPQISISDDTGMYRSWDQDEVYIYGAAIGLTPVYDKPIMYTVETPNYTAPEPIYKTQRSMGKQSVKYNLTWILPVDSGFYYMLRLHFCHIIPQYTKQGQVVFKIFINNQTADEELDQLNLTQGSGYPIFKDYIVFVNDPDGSRCKQHLWLALHPNNASEQYLEAYLNGLEAFKLSTDKNLASRNPERRCTTTPTRLTPTKLTPTVKENKKKSPYAVIIGGVGGAFVLLYISVFIVPWRLRRAKNNSSDEDRSPNPCRRFSLKDMKAATDEFNDNFVIGN
ncbi:putative non-specific serine/threonine protein kinase [Helianthus annuus]|uniref:Non-specific serine/threonine protein kinase n=1 Tax=Helianthus annuus TaxID=4232 RepID=A0A251SB50_HELAN|nr:putative non-specific serine/threonine protein kinase [Helianthus annuus]KAJ0452571.1 putative non-specific serine/threonine protein kinase [Helianthus annuus]KAJ0457512.1 putative non-specific serine/threonine protein kinase [Helianthus annuus]KAJ0474477.1 putative non-specific serine/threonine protein kinase [Helianthus annuus]KAJ0650034.1 putative non-specific serine/threonine protein kinase [Helianthus annuus]